MPKSATAPTVKPPAPITDSATLAEFCHRAGEGEFIALDTEFMRERSYWPNLCLVQIAGAGCEGVIDPLAPELDLSPLYRLLARADLVKLLHAGRQDLEIFYHLNGCLPVTLFDSQVAAMVLGYGEQLGYDALAQRLLGRRLDKSARVTDWARRPLGAAQLHYALGDVVHLRDMYPLLLRELQRSGRTPWFEEEMRRQTQPGNFVNDPEQAWMRLKVRKNDPRFLALLRAAAAWRERAAQAQDLPRGRVLHDDTLLALAAACPADIAALQRVQGVPKSLFQGGRAETLLQALAQAQNLPEEALPRPMERRRPTTRESAVAAMITALLKGLCATHRISPTLVADSSDILKLAMERNPDIPALQGWRRQLFGEQALALKEGKAALALRNGEITPLPLSEGGSG